MTLHALTVSEKEVVRRAMLATFDYFTFDFGTRMGIEADEMRQLVERWPNVDDTNDSSAACLGINNALNDLLNGQGISEQEAREKIGVSRDEMRHVYKKWARARGWAHTGLR